MNLDSCWSNYCKNDIDMPSGLFETNTAQYDVNNSFKLSRRRARRTSYNLNFNIGFDSYKIDPLYDNPKSIRNLKILLYI